MAGSKGQPSQNRQRPWADRTSFGTVAVMTSATGEQLTTAEAVRSAVRAFLDENFDRDISLRTWLERLVDSGWASPQWPTQWFGKGLSADLAAVAFDEFRKVKA